MGCVAGCVPGVVFGGGAPGVVLPEVVRELEVVGAVLGRVAGVEVCEEEVLGRVVFPVDGFVVPGDVVLGVVPVVVGGVGPVVTRDVDGGDPAVGPRIQLQALLTRPELLSHPDR